MKEPPSTRRLGELTFPEISRRLGKKSILCLPTGAIEQHGPHLPLDTDVVIAEGITRRLLTGWAEKFDLWQLPTVAIGLSREHEWAPGTLSLSITSFTGLLRDLGRSIRNLPTHNLAIVNGHGGNRGLLQNLLYELEGDFGLNTCVIHPLALAGIGAGPAVTEIHGGRDETSLMLALAPHAVRTGMIKTVSGMPDATAVKELVLDQGATWAWRSDDPRIAEQGVTGEPQEASAQFGETIITAIVREAGPVFARLLERERGGV
jgi:creatinine amidohydrolase